VVINYETMLKGHPGEHNERFHLTAHECMLAAKVAMRRGRRAAAAANAAGVV
jgi:hypothetical protein